MDSSDSWLIKNYLMDIIMGGIIWLVVFYGVGCVNRVECNCFMICI